MHEPKLRVSRRVKWYAYSDGLVVHVGETCETHLLPVVYLPLLSASNAMITVEDSGRSRFAESDHSIDRGGDIARTMIEQLIELKILDPLH